jgi:hypothetical protein
MGGVRVFWVLLILLTLETHSNILQFYWNLGDTPNRSQQFRLTIPDLGDIHQNGQGYVYMYRIFRCKFTLFVVY